MPQTCAKDRANIITLYCKKISLSQISKILSIHKSTVSRVIRRFLERGTIQRKFSPGRPRKCTKFTEKTVVRSCKKDPFLTASEIAQTLPIMIAPSTVRKILCKYNLKAKVYNKNLIISHINRVKRVTFCRTKLYQNSAKNGLNWWNVVFSDETMIELQPTRRILVRKPPNLGFHPLFTPKFKKVPAKN